MEDATRWVAPAPEQSYRRLVGGLLGEALAGNHGTEKDVRLADSICVLIGESGRFCHVPLHESTAFAGGTSTHSMPWDCPYCSRNFFRLASIIPQFFSECARASSFELLS